VTVPADAPPATQVTATLHAPDGWTVGAGSPNSVSRIAPGRSATFSWPVTTSANGSSPAAALTTTVSYTQSGTATTNGDERIVRSIPDPPPSGSVAVSDLPFLSATNGWGPVERDTSVGENQPGDGRPITIAGTTYAKGLGTNSVSDVQIYLGGRCSDFTATVGVDDETGSGGTVTFSVVADGTTLTTTGRLTGSGGSASIHVPLDHAQVLDLVVGDAGDGNGSDHGDWATPTLTCS
jgi:hypothetical protein